MACKMLRRTKSTPLAEIALNFGFCKRRSDFFQGQGIKLLIEATEGIVSRVEFWAQLTYSVIGIYLAHEQPLRKNQFRCLLTKGSNTNEALAGIRAFHKNVELLG